jgi:hypothetical protein
MKPNQIDAAEDFTIFEFTYRLLSRDTPTSLNPHLP